MAWTVRYTSDAAKQLRKLGPSAERRIRTYMSEQVQNLADPRQRGHALKGSTLGDFWRYRVGDYRVICDVRDDVLIVLVLEVGHRREVYR